MRCFDTGKRKGKAIEVHHSQGANIVHLLEKTRAYVATIYLDPDGVLGMHKATEDQLFLVVSGHGQAIAGEQRCELSAGTGVLWKQGEYHETRAGKEGLTAVVIEGDGLEQALAINRQP